MCCDIYTASVYVRERDYVYICIHIYALHCVHISVALLIEPWESGVVWCWQLTSQLCNNWWGYTIYVEKRGFAQHRMDALLRRAYISRNPWGSANGQRTLSPRQVYTIYVYVEAFGNRFSASYTRADFSKWIFIANSFDRSASGIRVCVCVCVQVVTSWPPHSGFLRAHADGLQWVTFVVKIRRRTLVMM